MQEAEAAGYLFAFSTGRCPASAQGASGLDISILPPVEAMKASMANARAGKDTFETGRAGAESGAPRRAPPF